MKNANSGKSFAIIVVGIFLLVGLLLLAYDIYVKATYEPVDAKITIHRSHENDVTASVSYKYNGEEYTDVALSSYNGFTMKDGRGYTVYVNPNNPEHVRATSFALDVFLIAFSGAALFIVLKRE